MMFTFIKMRITHFTSHVENAQAALRFTHLQLTIKK